MEKEWRVRVLARSETVNVNKGEFHIEFALIERKKNRDTLASLSRAKGALNVKHASGSVNLVYRLLRCGRRWLLFTEESLNSPLVHIR